MASVEVATTMPSGSSSQLLMEEIQSGIGGHYVTSGSRSTSPSPTGAKAASEAPDQETKTAEPATAAEEEDTYDSCCICFDGKEFVLTSCCHLFCLPCIKRWVEISGTCPICRNEFGQGVELYSLIGAVEDTVRAIKELQKRRKEQEKRREKALAQQRDDFVSTSSPWTIFHQVIGILFPTSADGERMLGPDVLQMDDDDTDDAEDPTQQQLALTRVDLTALTGQPAHNVAHSHQLNVTTSFPFLSFCCLPQPATAAMPPFQRSFRGSRIY